jgi:hypothetical protein
MTDMTISGAFEHGPSLAERFRALYDIWTDRPRAGRRNCAMLRLLRANLEVRFSMIDGASLETDRQAKTYAAVEKILTGEPSADGTEWDELCKAERMLALLYSPVQLREEIATRLQELATQAPKDAADICASHSFLTKPDAGNAAPAPDTDVLRMVLLRIMESLHWNAKKARLSRPIQKHGTTIVLSGVVLAFGLLVAPYLIVNVAGEAGIGGWWSVFALYTALSAGLMGAFFSRLVDAQRRSQGMSLDDVSFQNGLPHLLLRAGLGMCGALIVYFFLRLDIMTGPLFPEFKDVAIYYVDIHKVDSVQMSFVLPSKALALLTFWCLLAGFSEKLVPNILSSTEAQMTRVAPKG